MSAQPYYHYVLADKYSELGSYPLSVDTEHRVHCAGLGPERATRMCPLGLLEQLGVRLALHSDFTMAPAQVRYHVLHVTCHVSRVSAGYNTAAGAGLVRRQQSDPGDRADQPPRALPVPLHRDERWPWLCCPAITTLPAHYAH